MMARAIYKPVLTISVAFEVDEDEARALDALSGYGDDAFIEAFYEKLGLAYMKDHEQGLRRFLKTVRSAINPALAQIDDARRLLAQDAAKRKAEHD